METSSLSASFSRTYVCSRSSRQCVFRRSCWLFVVFVFVLSSKYTEGVQVTGGEITVVQGETVVLPCKLTDTKDDLTQISWQRKTKGKPQKYFFAIPANNGAHFFNGQSDDRFQFVGNISDFNGSLQLSNVTLMDEGVYTCIFTLFPSGNYKTEIPLHLLVPPVTSLKDNRPTLGNEEVSLVSCIASGSQPPAQVKWRTGTLEEKVRETTNSIQHANGTTTTISSLFGVPTREINQHLVQCVVTSAALLIEKTLPFTIQVYSPPMEVTVSALSNNSFQCVTKANPPAKFTWKRKRTDGLWPQSAVRAEGATLQLISMTSDLNGEYQCEASNPYGRKHGRLYLHVTSGPCTTSWILFGILLALNVTGAAAAWYFYQSGKCLRTDDRPAVSTAAEEEEEEELHAERSM